MARNWLNSKLPKPKYELNLRTGILKKNVTRKPFKTSTQKIEWNKSAGRADDDFKTTSKCRHCPTRFVWKKGGYQFDHKDNNPANNSQRNCHLVCATCHSKHTRIGKRKIKGAWGQTIGHKTIKKKVGYKKVKKAKKRKARKPKQPTVNDLLGDTFPKMRKQKAWKGFG